jgi:hypothetical protein
VLNFVTLAQVQLSNARKKCRSKSSYRISDLTAEITVSRTLQKCDRRLGGAGWCSVCGSRTWSRSTSRRSRSPGPGRRRRGSGGSTAQPHRNTAAGPGNRKHTVNFSEYLHIFGQPKKKHGDKNEKRHTETGVGRLTAAA